MTRTLERVERPVSNAMNFSPWYQRGAASGLSSLWRREIRQSNKCCKFGTDNFLTIPHELGHALDLKHGYDGSPNGALARDVNGHEFSVMTYASWLGSPPGEVTAAAPGSSPISFMMFDIAAPQAFYGANLSKVGTRDVYRWDAITGQQTIDGDPAPATGVTETKRIFSTVWTQGAVATYDLSNYTRDQVDDLRPGRFLKFSDGQLADLNNQAPPPATRTTIRHRATSTMRCCSRTTWSRRSPT